MEDEFYLADGSTVKSDFMNMTYGSHGFVGADGYTVYICNNRGGRWVTFIYWNY